jgi:hypothetical protein
VRRRRQHALLDRPAALPVDRLAAPQRAGQRQAFHHAADAFLERHAGGFELGADVGDIGGDADAENQPALRDLVDRRHLVREQHRVAQCWQEHRGAELDASRARRSSRKQGERIVPRPRQQRIADPDRIVAQALGPLGQL